MQRGFSSPASQLLQAIAGMDHVLLNFLTGPAQPHPQTDAHRQ